MSEEQDAFYRSVHAQYKELDDSLKMLSDQQIEISSTLKGINGHLSRLNGHVNTHEKEISDLKTFRTAHEVELAHEKERRLCLEKEKRQMIRIVVMLIGSLIVSLVVGYLT